MLDAAEPPDRARHQAARDPVRQEEVDAILLEQRIDERTERHRWSAAMTTAMVFGTAGAVVGAAAVARAALARWTLTRAKHPSLHGHARIARALAKQVRRY